MRPLGRVAAETGFAARVPVARTPPNDQSAGFERAHVPSASRGRAPRDLAIGTIGERIEGGSIFVGWGDVHLFDAAALEELDTFAIPEAHGTAFAFGFDDLSVHEVEVDPQDASLAYLLYHSGGLRAIQIQCGGAPYGPANPPTDTSTCELVEVGGYLDQDENNFWGVETFIGEDGRLQPRQRHGQRPVDLRGSVI